VEFSSSRDFSVCVPSVRFDLFGVDFSRLCPRPTRCSGFLLNLSAFVKGLVVDSKRVLYVLERSNSSLLTSFFFPTILVFLFRISDLSAQCLFVFHSAMFFHSAVFVVHSAVLVLTLHCLFSLCSCSVCCSLLVSTVFVDCVCFSRCLFCTLQCLRPISAGDVRKSNDFLPARNRLAFCPCLCPVFNHVPSAQ
jgi:hypothetical protein